jgi:predicted DNA-binding protein with PD1-like motif
MEYRKFENSYVVRLDPQDEIVACITELCVAEKISLASVHGLGASADVTLSLFDTKWKKYFKEEFKGEYEIASLMGNITQKDEMPYLHLHAVIGNVTTGETHAGHLTSAVISATAELIITAIPGQIGRKFSETIGLNLLDF